MCEKSLIAVNNPNVEIIDVFKFKCTACGHEFDPDEAGLKCSECKAVLFEPMRKSTFKEIFIASLSTIGIPSDKITKFITKGSSKVSDMGICTELSVVVDINFQIKFGGQYKAFSIKDSIKDIVSNNFN